MPRPPPSHGLLTPERSQDHDQDQDHNEDHDHADTGHVTDGTSSGALRVLTRSPHPYHRQQFQLLHPADGLPCRRTVPPSPLSSSSPASPCQEDGQPSAGYSHDQQEQQHEQQEQQGQQLCRSGPAHGSSNAKFPPRLSRESTIAAPTASLPAPAAATSDSGTEADDEHFLRGLPAPRTRLHKGVRGLEEPQSGASTPAEPGLSGTSSGKAAREDRAGLGVGAGLGLGLGLLNGPADGDGPRHRRQASIVEGGSGPAVPRRVRALVRRAVEAALLAILALAVMSNPDVIPLRETWGCHLRYLAALVAGLLVLYPVRRRASWARHYRGHTGPAPTTAPAVAPVPARLPVAWFPPAALRSSFDPAPLLYPPIITLLATLLTGSANPAAVLPNLVLAICSIPAPLIPLASHRPGSINLSHWILSCLPLVWRAGQDLTGRPASAGLNLDLGTLVLLYPLHQTLSSVLRQIISTSLLPAELQLVTIALIDLLLLSRSAQMMMLAGLLWIGGLATLVLSGPVIRWGIALARVPKWRFRTARPPASGSASASAATPAAATRKPHDSLARTATTAVSLHRPKNEPLGAAAQPAEMAEAESFESQLRGTTDRSTLPGLGGQGGQGSRASRSDPRRRSASAAVKPLLRLTAEQAAWRRWLYAAHVYGCGIGTYLIGRLFLVRHVFDGYDPVCWGLAYLLGDADWFRRQVIGLGWDRHIPLPQPTSGLSFSSLSSGSRLYSDHICRSTGWAERVRRFDLGLANTRLVIVGYFLLVMAVGFGIVLRLRDVYEVDTRRKGFHFMMVAWWLPTIFVDPALVALLYIANLALFLVADLLRASQLPPLSRPIAAFIAPYVDGRDLAGPVVVSPIFLLIGCAIPLWLSLAAVPRGPAAPPDGVSLPDWEVATREVAMVAGVVCVGLGDAAASLVGRRWGHHKWPWGGSKSLEGSAAFAAAAGLGLAAAQAWLRLGGWAVAGDVVGWPRALRNTGICATLASVTEAVLTGGNDNVIVPVMLWTCVKGLGV